MERRNVFSLLLWGFMTLLVFVAVSCTGSGSKTPGEVSVLAAQEEVVADRIDVYYFHNRMRCPSCVAIENVAKSTLTGLFARELEDGRVVFHILNIEDSENRQLAEKYQAFGPTLIVSSKAGGLETITDLTGDGFRFAMRDEARFASVLKTTVEKSL